MPRRLILTLLFMLLPFLAHAREVSFDIVALVNEDVITRHELNNRLRIAFSGSKLPDTRETRAKLTPQMLQMLVDETLQRQEAKRLNIEVSESERARAQSEVAKQSGVAEDKLFEYIQKQGLDKDAVMKQIESQILWTKVIYKKVRPQIRISDQEIADTIAKVKAMPGSQATEIELAEIVLPVATADEEQNVQQLASKLYEELNNGADFGAVAKEFSTSSTSTKKGIIGWLAVNDLEPTLRQAVDGLEAGALTFPVRTPRGYMILKVLNKRDGTAPAQAQPEPDAERVREVLTLRKMELEARRYLSSLRDQAYIEKRL